MVRYLVGIVICWGALALADVVVWFDHQRAREGAPGGPIELTLVLAAFGGVLATGALLAAALKYHTARWPARLRSIRFSSESVTIAAAPRDGVAAVALEGRVQYVTEATELRAPVSNAPCVYHRVRVEEQLRRPGRGLEWCEHEDSCMAQPFVVTDTSGFVYVDPLADALKPTYPYLVPVDIDLETFVSVSVHESPTGVSGLPPEARAYVEAHRARLTALHGHVPIRVREAVLREGDVVSVFGTLSERVVPKGAFRHETSERVPVMSASAAAFRVVPARLRELRWLLAFHRRVVLGLVFCAALGLLVTGSTVVRLLRLPQ